MSSEQEGKPKYRVVYTIIAKPSGKVWLKIGAAFINRDGSENVLLDAMPVNGQLQIRDYVPLDGSRKRAREREAEALPEAMGDELARLG